MRWGMSELFRVQSSIDDMCNATDGITNHGYQSGAAYSVDPKRHANSKTDR